MGDRLFKAIIVLLFGGLVVVGSLAIARFCEEELTKMVPVIDPLAVEMYQGQESAARASLRAGETEGALR